ncbi:MAG: hypothetical protein FJ279_09435 [Planctomycetes bacterium]|nr:hypothetical protein [Planctomycetota bacterium]
MRSAMVATIAVLLAANSALATREPTAPPVYYLIDYGGNHLDNPKYVEWVKELPPELLHFGKDVPMTHLWGPIAAVGGENQAHGRNRADVRRLTPAEVRDRIAALQRMNKALHEAGVKMVMPYISAITYAGDPKTREGFFSFYDHWDEYAEFGVGPKPKTDPLEWAGRKADGSFSTFGTTLTPDYYAGLNRYVACIEHPDWRRWLEEVTRLVAVAGYDGAFPDNSSAYHCHAAPCQAAFGRYLAEKFRPEQLQALFGTRDAAAIPLPKERGSLLWVEANRFWQTSLARHLGAMRAAGRRANPRFLLFPNCGSPIQSAEFLAGHVDYFMFEGSGRMPEGAGCVLTPIIGNVTRRRVIDNILAYRYCADVPGDIRPMFLELGRTASSRKLCLAEAAAFGSGAYNGVRPNTRDVQRPYIEFLLKHKALYDGKVSASAVAIPYFPTQGYYPNSRHPGGVVGLKDRLGALQIPFDCFSETGLALATLRTYAVCIVPELKYASNAHVEVLRDYVRGGGRLLLLGEFATHDDLCRERPAPDWLPPTDGERKLGGGVVVHRALMPTATQMLQLLAPAGEPRLVVEPRPMLRAMMYESPTERIIHLLNYNCPVEGQNAEPVAEKDVRTRIPLPQGKGVKALTCLVPEGTAFSPPFEVRDHACWFTLPEVALYVVCRLELHEGIGRR